MTATIATATTMYRYLSWGCGLQSTTLLAMSALGELERLDAAITADTHWERRRTYETRAWYQTWAEEHDVRVEIVSAGDIRVDGTAEHMHLPFWTASGGPLRRQCTGHFKITPLKKRMRELAGFDPSQPPHPAPGAFELWLGISWDEWERIADSHVQFIQHRYPLIERKMTRDDCADWLRDHGLPVPGKSACIGCPYRSASEWLEMHATCPDEWAEAVAFDEANRNRLPLEDAGVQASALYIWQGVEPLATANLEEAARRERTMKKVPLFVCTGTHCWT